MGYTSISRRWVYSDQFIGNFPSIDDKFIAFGYFIKTSYPFFLGGFLFLGFIYIVCTSKKNSVDGSNDQNDQEYQRTPYPKKAPPITSFI